LGYYVILRIRFVALTATALALWTRTAGAEPGGSDALAAAQATSSAREHHGFYLRVGGGPAVAGTSISADSLAQRDYDVSGLGFNADIMVGGSPLAGIATGGAVSFTAFGHGDGESANLLLIGAFVDAFPDAADGFHLGGLLGVASVRASRDDAVDDFAGGGLGLAAWVGHGLWLSDEWSLGAMLAFKGALAREPSVDDVLQPADLRSATYDVALTLSALYY
jgi:hypothetical protein